MPIFIDAYEYEGKGYADIGSQVYQATDGYDLFVFSMREGNGNIHDAILDFGKDDKIRFIDSRGDFDDLTFEVDRSENTITIRYDDSGNWIVLRNAGGPHRRTGQPSPDGEELPLRDGLQPQDHLHRQRRQQVEGQRGRRQLSSMAEDR